MPTVLHHRLRPILAAIVVLILSGGAVAAGQPSSVPVDGRTVAAEHTSAPSPVAPAASDDEDEPDVDADADSGADADSDAGANASEADANVEAPDAENDHCVDPSTLTPEVLAETNHGGIVCWAAQQETPDGYDNHGQWVSSWAKQNHGHGSNGASAASHGKGQH